LRYSNSGCSRKDPHITDFTTLGLLPSLLQAVSEEGYTSPTPIQQQAIPPVLAGRDLLGCAQTGTGKTAAFALPILQRLAKTAAPIKGKRPMRALILSPTRELASQIADSFRTYGRHLRLTVDVIFGGVGATPQIERLRRGADILVATPGRLLDLANQGHVDLKSIEIFVLDEADRMLDMGFIHDVKRVLKLLPAQRQSLFFSATVPDDIQKLAGSILKDPVKVAVTPTATTAERIRQSVYFVDKAQKRPLLAHVLKDPAILRALVFTRTKHLANRLTEQLARDGVIAEAIHGNKSQGARERALANFRAGTTPVLIATDIAARGIDVDGVSHVINFELPNIPESYVHRIGRTARAGAEGIAISFCDPEERGFLRDIENTIRMKVPVVANHPFTGPAPASSLPPPREHRRPAAPANSARLQRRPAARAGSGAPRRTASRAGA
jgi:ATP-dependent RNA helicase RhlE